MLYFVFGYASFLTAVSHSIVTPIFFAPEGIALAASILIGPRVWPGVFIGQLALALSWRLAWEPALCISAINSLEAVLGVFLIRRWGVNPALVRTRDLALLLCSIFFVLQPFSATLGIATLWFHGIIPNWQEYQRAWINWWLSNAMAQSQLTPLLLVIFFTPDRLGQSLKKMFVPLLLLISAGWLAFSDIATNSLSVALVIFIPLLLWIADRGGIALVCVASSVITLFALSMTGQGIGPFVVNGKLLILDMNLFILGLSLPMQFFSMQIYERQYAEDQIRELSIFSQTILDGVTSNISVIDERGEIIVVNRPWREFAAANGGIPQKVNEGVNYLAVCEQFARGGDDEAQTLVNGLRDVLGGRRDTFQFEYPCHLPTEERWFIAKILRLSAKPTRFLVSHENITAFKRTVKQLRATLDNTPNVAIQWYDQTGRVTYWNRVSENLFGWPSREAIGKTLDQLIYTPAEMQAYLAMLQRIRETGRPIGPFESQFRHKEGRIGWLLSTTFAIPMEGGIGFVCMDVDITERKCAEDELRTSKQLLDNIIEYIPSMIFLKRASDLRFALFNRAGEELLGVARENLLDHNDYDFFTKEQADFFTEKDRLVLQQQGVTDIPEEPIATAHGTRILHTRKIALRDDHGNPLFLLGISEDITQHKQAEARLSESQKFNQSILLNSPIAMGVYHASGQCVLVNEAYAHLVGATREKLLAQDFYKLDSWRKTGLLDDCLKSLAEIRQSRREVRVRSSFGQDVCADCLILPIVLNNEPHLLLQFFDLTEIRKTTEAMRDAQTRAEVANHAKSEFLANMSHEIRTPMNAIIGLSSLALGLDLTPKLRDYLNKISVSAKALLSILNDILDYSKVEAGHLELESTAFSLTEVLENIVNLFSVRANEQGLDLTVEIAPDVSDCLVGDPLRLSQVLTNLIGNAIKFTASGKVWVKVKRITAEPGFASLRFTVQDTGIGMNEDQIHHLFQAFTQVDGSITRRFGGTGLGLAISQRLVGLMGSKIVVASVPGQGSEFSFTIRLAIPEGVHAASHPVITASAVYQPSAAIRGARVLLVEDNEINQQVAREILERWKFSVAVAGDGKQALATLESVFEPFDIVLMDVHMPVMDGLEATRRIRRDSRFNSVLPVIAMTAAVMAKDQVECLEAGMNDHVAKPILPEQLLGVLERWITPGERNVPAREVDESTLKTDILPDHLPGFDIELATQRLSDNRELLGNLLKQFGKQFATASETIMGLIAQNQHKEAAQQIHQIKGTAGNLGAMELHRHAETLERELKNGQLSVNQTAFDQALGVVLASISTLSSSSPPESTDVPYDWPRATALIKELRTLLDEGEFIPLELVSELQEALPNPLMRDDLARFKDQVATLDYSAASEIMAHLISYCAKSQYATVYH
ncbi:two-component system, sensor histidine kinase and response regulator [Gammaproteobacteria bacterium]